MARVTYPLDSLTVKRISQCEADRCLKKAYKAYELLSETQSPAGKCKSITDLRAAFPDELTDRTKPVWALPEVPEPGTPDRCRLYFLVSSPAGPELLAAIHAKRKNNISSFAKIFPDQRSKAKGLDCIRRFIECEVVPLCQGKFEPAAVTTATECGKRVMCDLSKQKNLPRGIQKIEGSEKIDAVTFILHLDPVGPTSRSD